MPITKNALKKQRVDKKRTKVNDVIKFEVKGAVKAAKKTLDQSSVKRLYKALDRAVAKKVVNLSKASRIKMRILKAAKRKAVPSPFAKAQSRPKKAK